jgi:hypothetical protein
MELDDLYEKLSEAGVFQLPALIAKSEETDKQLLAEIRRLNGQCRDNRWNIRGIWAVVVAEAGLFCWWVKSQFTGGS